MLINNLHVLIMGGDARYLEVIHTIADEGAKIYLAGFDQLTFDNPNISNTDLDKIDFSRIDAVILPVAGTDTGGEVEATYSEKSIIISEEIIAQTSEDCVIYTGTSNTFLDHAAKSTNRKLVKLFARDDIAIFNSIPTAEGALKLAIEETDVTIHGANVMVLGFGRVGMTVARLFDSVGANVRVGVRRSTTIARITEMGLKPVHINNLEKEIAGIDICINTIPHQVIDSTVILTMKSDCLILDLASKPGGTDFDFADKQGVKALHALGLPGKTAPKTAGRIIAGVLLELMRE